VSEWTYNSELAPLITVRLNACGWTTHIIDEYDADDYVSAMRWLTNELTELGPRCAVELHFNSEGSGAARGHEWFHNNDGQALATALDQTFRSLFPRTELPGRGVTNRHSSGNGSRFLGGAPCPAVIGEPFFGSNASDWAIGQDKERIANAYAVGIGAWLGVCRTASPRDGARQAGAAAGPQ